MQGEGQTGAPSQQTGMHWGLGWQSSLAAGQQPPPPPQPHTEVKDKTAAPDSSHLEVQLPPALRKSWRARIGAYRSSALVNTGDRIPGWH